MNPIVEKLQSKIKNSLTYRFIYALEEDFNKIGLTIAKTTGGRAVLCKIIEGKASAKELFEDYLFIGSYSDLDTQIPEKLTNTVVEFIQKTAGEPAKIEQTLKPWQQHNMLMYGGTIKLTNEAVQYVAQHTEEHL